MNILIIGSGPVNMPLPWRYIVLRSNCKFCCGTSTNPGLIQMTHNYWVGDITDVDTIVSKKQRMANWSGDYWA